MLKQNSAIFYIEIDINKNLCKLDGVQDISLEFVNLSDPQQKIREKEILQERIIDIDINQLFNTEEKRKHDIYLEINGEDAIVVTSNGPNPKDEVDILQIDDTLLLNNPQLKTN